MSRLFRWMKRSRVSATQINMRLSLSTVPPKSVLNRLDVYNTDGKKVTSIDFDYAYTGVLIDGDRLILYNEESCREYNLDGHERFNGQFDFPVSLVRAGKNRTNSLITAGSEVMKEIKLR